MAVRKEELIRNYAKAIREGNAAIFGGAGLSRSSGFVDWKGLLRPLASDIGLDVDKETDMLSVAQFYKNQRRTRAGINQAMYDEIRYSLESREGNRTNGLVAVYTPEAANLLVNVQSSGTVSVNTVDNLFRKNMMNVKPQYKKNPNPGIFDRDYDSYCSLIEWDEFIKNIGKYIEIASQKRDAIYKYDITKRL